MGNCIDTRVETAMLSTLKSLAAELLTPGGGVAEPSRFAGKQVALYFSAGWCPMCTDFEPALLAFLQGKPIELIYVSSDRDEASSTARAKMLNAVQMPFADEAARNAIKTKYKVWAGAERGTLGNDRRSGLPALVLLGPEDGEEVAFVAAESEGDSSLDTWP